jgi:hypothetical protein
MAAPPQDRRLLDALLAGLYSFRLVASMRHNVKVEVGGVEFEIKDSTTDAQLDHFIHEIERATPTTAAQPEAVQDAKEAVIMLPPFQFDWLNDSIVSSNGVQLHLPHRLANPLKGMFSPDPLNPKAYVTYLSYFDVAMKYKEGWIDDYHPSLDQKSKEDRLEVAKVRIVADPQRFAGYWRGELSKLLNKPGIKIEKEQIFSCWEKSGYRLGIGWLPTKPLINATEPSLFFGLDPERHPCAEHKDEQDE